MNEFWKLTLINIAGVFVITVFIALFNGKEVFYFLPIALSFFEFLLAIILVFFEQTRRAAQIMLAASGIVFLIGLGVCTVNFI